METLFNKIEPLEKLLDYIPYYSFWGNELKDYVLALVTLIVIYLLFRFIVFIILLRLEKWAEKTKNDIDDKVLEMLEKCRWLVFLIIAVVYIDVSLNFSSNIEKAINWSATILAVLLGIKMINFWVEYVIQKMISHKAQAAEQMTMEIIGKMIKVLVWIIAVLFLISYFGYDITSLVAGLGIGGIAVALAVQNVLADLISAVSIYLDKPFKVGDYIVIGTQMGTVKNIGLKTTRITSLQGEEIVISNKKLTESEINNFGRMKKRRVVIPIGVTYDTKLRKMKKIPNALKKIVDSVKDTTFDRAHFKKYGDFSKIFELVFYVESQDYATYMDRLESINLKIQEYFEKEKIKFAFPTQTVHVKR